MVGQIYPTELQLNKANSSDTEAPFLDLSITNGIVSSKIYDKRDDFNFEIVNFPFLDGDVPRSPSYGVYISQLIRFARVCSNVDDFNNRNLFSTSKLLKQGYRYHKIRKAFSKFYHRHSELIVKYNIGLKTLQQQGISEPIFYGDLVYKFKRIVGKPNFSDQFKKIVKHYIRVGSPYLACSDRNAFFNSEKPKKYHAWSCQNVCDALTFLLDNIFIRFGTKLYRQVVGIPMGTNCAPLVADLFLFCYERDFMMALSEAG